MTVRRRRTARVAVRLAALLSLPLAFSACTDDAPARPNIVLFTIDTLRADRLGCYGNRTSQPSPSPFIDSLADAGVRFERCFAPRGLTHPSLASMLTGTYPITHGLRDNGLPLSFSNTSVATLLKQRGYRTAAFAANLDRGRWDFWIRGFDVAEDGTEGKLAEEGRDHAFEFQRIWDQRTCSKAAQWVKSLPDDGVPFFLWVHVYDVHAPYTPLAEDSAPYVDPSYDGPIRHPTGAPGDTPSDQITDVITSWTLGQAPFDASDLAQVRALYDAGIRGCDRELAALHGVLSELGLLDDALVVLSADHGEELADHHRFFGHGASVYDSTLHIPLIMSWPGRVHGGRTTDQLAQNLDLFPTILDAAGVDVPPESEGFSLLPLLTNGAPTGREYVFAEWEDLVYTISDGSWKLIHNPQGARPRKPPYNIAPPDVGFPLQCFELYDLRADSLEQINHYRRDHERALALNRALAEFLGDPRHRLPMTYHDPATAAANLEALEQLGYVGSTDGRNVATIPCGDQR